MFLITYFFLWMIPWIALLHVQDIESYWCNPNAAKSQNSTTREKKILSKGKEITREKKTLISCLAMKTTPGWYLIHLFDYTCGVFLVTLTSYSNFSCWCVFQMHSFRWVSKLIRKRHDSSVTSVAWHPNNVRMFLRTSHLSSYQVMLYN